MATSPNFGWLEPDNTDLVKNGALAIRTLGDAIDASLVDLKGGTTGQVLAKASNTDMDFVWAADAGAPESLGFAAGKNKIINGDFRINQRSFTSNTTTGTFNFDRFKQVNSGGTSTVTPQTFTAGTAPVSGYEAINFLQIVTASQSGVNDYAGFNQPIEDVRTFAGQTVTMSFWAKASTGTPSIGVAMYQDFGSGGSSAVTTSPATQTITTSWARYSFTVAVPSISGKTIGTGSNLAPHIFTSVGTGISSAGFPAVGIQNITAQFWGIQVEAGSVATAFQTATGTIQGELAACQRYYVRFQNNANNCPFTTGGFTYSTTGANTFRPLPVEMRIAPTAVETGGNISFKDVTATNFTPSAYTMVHTTNQIVSFDVTITGATSGRWGFLQSNDQTTVNYIAFSAEL
jgi:hypothetical protein